MIVDPRRNPFNKTRGLYGMVAHHAARPVLGAGSVGLLFLLLCIAGVQGQEMGASFLVEDPAGDVRFDDIAPEHPMDAIDLVALAATQEPTGLTLDVEVAGTTGLAFHDSTLNVMTMRITITYRAEPFHIDAWIDGDGVAQTFVTREDGFVTHSGTTAFEQNHLRIALPWEALESSSGFSPSALETLTLEAWASAWDVGKSSSTEFHATPAYGSDEGDLDGLVHLTVAGSVASISLSSPDTVIRGNGEETTFAWTVDVRNHAPEAQQIRLTMQGPPQSKVFVTPHVDIDGNMNQSVRAYAVVPFGHAHGTTRDFTVVAEAGDDTAELVLQVLYVDPPQPAGHHNTVYIHTAPTDSANEADSAWLSTLQANATAPAAAFSYDCTPSNPGWGWHLPLRPALEIGLDGIADATAQLNAVLDVDIPLPPVDLRARLALGAEGHEPSPTLDDEYTAVLPFSPSPGQSTSVQMDIPLPPEMDRVAYSPGTNLFLLLYVCSTTSDPSEAFGTIATIPFQPFTWLNAGGSLELPLIDYRPEDFPETRLKIDVGEPFIRAPPGATVEWRLHFASELAKADVQLIAAPEYEAIIASDEPGPQRTLVVRMTVPEEARPGGLLDFVVAVTLGDQFDEVRLGVIVDEAAAAPSLDDLGTVQETPGMGILLVGCGIGAAVLVRRKRL